MQQHRAAMRERIYAETGERLRAEAAPAAHTMAEHALICGSPATVAEALAKVAAIGVGGLIAQFRLGPMSREAAAQSLELFSRRVRPELGCGRYSAMTGLRELLAPGRCLVLPGIFDGISARIADTIGFAALYMTGYGSVASALGMPDAGIATYSEMLDRVRCIAGAVRVPFIADADTGYGGLLNVDRTVRGYAAAGAAAIQLEDQEFPEEMRTHRASAGDRG